MISLSTVYVVYSNGITLRNANFISLYSLNDSIYIENIYYIEI